MSEIEGSPPRVSRTIAFAVALFLALAVSSVINSGLGALAPLITEDLDISRLQFGVLASVVSLAAGLASPFAGRVADRYGGRRTILLLFVVAGGSWALAGLATTYGLLMALTLLLSVPLALGNPATNLLVMQHVPREEQGLSVGLKQAGVPASMVITGLALPPLAVAFGWRLALQTLVLFCVLGLALTLRAVPPDEGRVRGGGRARVDPTPEQRRMARWFALYAFLMGSGMAAVSAFLPLFAHDELGVPVSTAGQLAATIGVSSIGSRIAWGYLSDRTWSVSTVLRWMGIMAFISTMGLVLASYVDWRLAWLASAGFGATAAAWHTPIMLAVVREVGPGAGGFVSGKVVQGFLIGKVASPVLFGWAVDNGAGYVAAWSGLGVCFLLAALVQRLRDRAFDRAPA